MLVDRYATRIDACAAAKALWDARSPAQVGAGITYRAIVLSAAPKPSSKPLPFRSRCEWPATVPQGRFAVVRTEGNVGQMGQARYATYEDAALAAGMHRDLMPEKDVEAGVDYQPTSIRRAFANHRSPARAAARNGVLHFYG